MKSIFFSLFVFIGVALNGQIPNHFVLGEEQFSNTDIYNIFKSTSNELYVATGNGVYVFRQNEFVQLPKNNLQKGNSFFDFKTDLEDNLYVKNLKGQIFRIEKNELKLIYQSTIQEGIAHLYYFFNTKNQLCVFDKDFYKIDEFGKKKLLFETAVSSKIGKKHQINRPSILDHNYVYFECFDKDDKEHSYIYRNDSITSFNSGIVNWRNGIEPHIRSSTYHLRLKEIPIFLSDDRKVGSPSNNIIYNFKQIANENYFSMGDGRIIASNNTAGLRIFDLNDNIFTSSAKLFPKKFISTCFSDHKNAIYLGTFGGGIIVVPNVDAVKIATDKLMSSCAVANDQTVFLTSRGGTVYQFKNTLTQIDQRSDNVDRLIYLASPIKLPKGKNSRLLTSVIDEIGTVKDFFESNNGCWLAGNGGITFIPYFNDTTKIPSWLSKTKFQHQNRGKFKYSINGVPESFTTVAFQDKDQVLYMANYKGLYYVLGNKISMHHQLKDSIQPSDIEIYNDSIIVSTQNNGIYYLVNNKVVSQLTVENGLLSNRIVKIEKDGGLLYILTDKGFQVLNLATSSLKTLGIQEGVNSNAISDFEFNSSHILFLENEGFYWLTKDKFLVPDTVDKFLIDSVMIGGQKIDLKQNSTFNYKSNDFKLFFNFSNPTKQKEAYFTHQLVGYDEQEKVIPSSTNEIVYPSLAPGLYHFKMALHYRQLDPQIFHYTFEISAPFWHRWWFYLLIVLTAGFAIYLVLQRKLKIQAKESSMINELNSAKLAAIQSQMNPHFIFNALNSIQHLVIEGDSKQAYNYITQFSNLVRKTLDFSEKESISILQEFELIEIYLELESLRFGNEFEYQINKNNVKDICVPPMLIQPFIENAIVHGLLHQRGPKRLKIDLELQKDVLYCEVLDNGIGREESRKIRERQNSKRKSFALKAIQNRFRILGEYTPDKVGYEYFDINDSGDYKTKVVLRIPIIKNG
ncbi:MAG: sensor histidine kinase [Crocinitomicaceae bacterium]